MIPSSTYFLTKFANLYGSHSGQSRRKYRKLAFLNLNKFRFFKLSMVENLEKHFDSGG